jgi:hypothetical protein
MSIGRNEPCPCGSGKKYKHCCLNSGTVLSPKEAANKAMEAMYQSVGVTNSKDFDKKMQEYSEYCQSLPEGAHIPSFMEYQGKANAASAYLSDYKNKIEGMNFNSLEELNAYTAQQNEIESNTGIDDFLGLSPNQMTEIIYKRPSKLDDIVWFMKPGSEKELIDIPVIQKAFFLYKLYRENDFTLDLTTAGYFKTGIVARFKAEFLKDEEWALNKHKEADISSLQMLHDMFIDLDFVSENGSKSRLSKKAQALFKSSDWADIYLYMLEGYLYGIDWLSYSKYQIDYTGAELIQSAAIFSLLILSKQKDKIIDSSKVYEAFLKAFPDYDKKWLTGSYLSLPEGFYRGYFLDLFCVETGLLEKLGDLEKGSSGYKLTPLFKNIFKWQL